uniref:Leucine-rich repeat-containing protein 14 n=1 Tax=Electrophorus electricus TaxID=8005 RepID=A0A4W4FRL8_ELEEL
MVRSLVSLCAREVVRDHGSSPVWLSCVPRELYRPLLEAAFDHCRPLAIGELVQRWPERVLAVGGRRKPDQCPPNRLCIQALLLAVVRGLTDKRCKACGGEAYCQREPGGLTPQDVMVRGVRRRMELERRSEGQQQNCDPDWQQAAVVRVRADLFINARSWERVRGALSLPGPLRLHCRYLRVEELPAASIGALLALLPRQGLLGLDVRYSSLGVAGLALLLPLLAPFPLLHTLRLHYCNLDLQRSQPGQQEVLQDMSQGLALLTRLCRLSLTALRLPGHLRLLLRYSRTPLEVLELPYLSLTPADLAYLSSSQHASSLRELDLSENRLDESSLPSLQRLLAQGEGRLTQLSLCGCSLSDGLLGALLPSLSRCRVLKSLRLALNPLSRAGVVRLACAAAGIPTLQLLLYPTPLEEYEPGLSPTPSSAQLLDWPLVEGDAPDDHINTEPLPACGHSPSPRQPNQAA